jgi:hypothetical protein
VTPNRTEGCEPLEAERLEWQLHDLREAHVRLLAAMADLEGITRTALCDHTYMHVRFRLSAASLARRRLWQEIFRTLEPMVDEADAVVLSELREGDLQMLRLSATHVGTWTGAAVEARWSEYSEASREIRSRMARAISKEQRLLYPLLVKYARAARRPVADEARSAA